MRRAKFYKNGQSQAGRLPKAFRFNGEQVGIKMRVFIFIVFLMFATSSFLFAEEEKYGCSFNGYTSYYCATGGFEHFVVFDCDGKSCVKGEKIFLSDFLYVLENVYKVLEKDIELKYDGEFFIIRTYKPKSSHYSFVCKYLEEGSDFRCVNFYVKVDGKEISVKEFKKSGFYRNLVKSVSKNRPFVKMYSLKDVVARKVIKFENED